MCICTVHIHVHKNSCVPSMLAKGVATIDKQTQQTSLEK